MDLATLNENSNNNNHMSTPRNLYEKASSIIPPADASTAKSKQKDSPPLVSKLCLNPSPPQVLSSSLPLSLTSPEGLVSSAVLLRPCGPLCDCANCASSTPTAPLDRDEQPGDSPHLPEPKDDGDLSEVKTESRCAASSDALPELMTMDLEEDKPAVACYIGQQQETLMQLAEVRAGPSGVQRD
ncbi:hypothetical protein E3U43_000420 [Larimichthys crocea]|uniref:Uncharacterized protein n=1 Tax=Larimichthys crocea TaxID=215358 RepID=A0ACD3Q8L9_LARCR|nr:hypothetical protein E3U43_000420 [Larimichthys crocea]